MTEPEKALREILPAARRIARHGGRRHYLWPIVFDAESVLADTPTTVKFATRDEGIERLLDLLRSYVEPG